MARHTLIFLAIGVITLGIVLFMTDLRETWEHVILVGWLFFIVLALYMGEFLANTAGWQFTFRSLRADLRTTLHLWRVMMAGEALNLVSAHLGGEGAKVLMLKRLYGVPYGESTASLVLFRTMNILMLIVFSVIGLTLAVLTEKMAESDRDLAVAGFALYAVAVIVMLVVPRLRFASRAGERLLRGKMRAAIGHIVALENQLLEFYRMRRCALFFAAVFSFLNWVLGVVTLYYTFIFIGMPIGFADAWIAETFIQLVRAASFFVPGHLGAQEGAFVLIATTLTGSPEAGLAASFVRRGREIVWAAAGIALVWRDRGNLMLRPAGSGGDGP